MVLMKIFLALMLFFSCSVTQAQQTPDPLKQVTKSFPNTIKIKKNGKQIEFCPDETCEGFVSSKLSPAHLRNFAYLFLYYFSGYTDLEQWRTKTPNRVAAERILKRPEFATCREENPRIKARCSLFLMNRQGVRVYFSRDDEGERNFGDLDLAEETK